MTTLTLRRTGRRSWTLTSDTGAVHGTLRTGRGLVHADATAADGNWSVRAHGAHRRRVTAGPPGNVALALDPPLARSTRRDAPARWETPRGFRRYEGLLTHAGGRISARTSTRPGATVTVEVTGHQPDLVMLTVCFALLTRRRRDWMWALWVAAITSHGPR